MAFSHLTQTFLFFRFASPNIECAGLVRERAGSFGGLFSGEVGGSRGIVFERPFFPLVPVELEPVVDEPSSKSVSIAFSRV